MVRVTPPQEKSTESLDLVRALKDNSRGVLRASDLRQPVGTASWVAGLLPELQPFVEQLSAALASPDGAKRALIYFKRVCAAHAWLERFFAGTESALVGMLFARSGPSITRESGTCPWVRGAATWSTTCSNQRRTGPPAALLHDRIGDQAGHEMWAAMPCCWPSGNCSLVKRMGLSRS